MKEMKKLSTAQLILRSQITRDVNKRFPGFKNNIIISEDGTWYYVKTNEKTGKVKYYLIVGDYLPNLEYKRVYL